MPRITWIMPVYNAEATLSDALQSVRGQSFRDWNMVAVDDGSTDGSGELLEHEARRDPRLRVIRCPHRGIAHTVNQALHEADAEWIARMDADDLNHPQRLEKQLAFAEAQPQADVIATRVEHLGCGEQTQGFALYVAWMNALLDHDEMARERFVEQPLANPSTLVRRSAFDRYGHYRDGDFPEDYELWLRWFDAGARFAKLPETLLSWRDLPGRFTRSDPRCTPENVYALKAQWLARELQKHQHRPLWVWGAGRTTRQRAGLLEKHEMNIAAWIDIDPAKIGQTIGGKPVYSPEAIPPAGEVYVLGYVGSRGARELIRQALREKEYGEGRDFWMLA